MKMSEKWRLNLAKLRRKSAMSLRSGWYIISRLDSCTSNSARIMMSTVQLACSINISRFMGDHQQSEKNLAVYAKFAKTCICC